MKKPITPDPPALTHAPQPCKPRRASTHTDKLPMVFRDGSLDALALPRIIGKYRVWPDGRKEPI